MEAWPAGRREKGTRVDRRSSPPDREKVGWGKRKKRGKEENKDRRGKRKRGGK